MRRLFYYKQWSPRSAPKNVIEMTGKKKSVCLKNWFRYILYIVHMTIHKYLRCQRRRGQEPLYTGEMGRTAAGVGRRHLIRWWWRRHLSQWDWVEFNLVYDVTPFVILPHTHYTGRRKKRQIQCLSDIVTMTRLEQTRHCFNWSMIKIIGLQRPSGGIMWHLDGIISLVSWAGV